MQCEVAHHRYVQQLLCSSNESPVRPASIRLLLCAWVYCHKSSSSFLQAHRYRTKQRMGLLVIGTDKCAVVCRVCKTALEAKGTRPRCYTQCLTVPYIIFLIIDKPTVKRITPGLL